ncbi:tetratricopeptide repeat protein [Vreelandella utahensis]|uniref:tetratricopeptide repeat protein n=1 Tax=Vreelandella halophila TaxID=86177 RepID=UPI0015C3D810|nr:tetratricopeptide repeat protein [Halomonas utahensis]
MKRRAEWGVVFAMGLLAGCSGMQPGPEPGRMPDRVELVTPALAPSDREQLEQVRASLAGGRVDAAGRQLERVEGDHRFHPDVLMLRAMVARHQERPKQAVRALEALLDQSPEHAAAANDLALLYRQQGRIDPAAALLRQALEVNPEHPQLHYNLAVLSELYLLDLEQALAHYRRYQSLTEVEDEEVALWIRDLERRVE